MKTVKNQSWSITNEDKYMLVSIHLKEK